MTAAEFVATVPAELRERRQWVIWREEHRENEEKPTKVPYQPAAPSMRASSTDASTWATFEEALAASSQADGIGYVFAADDPYTGVDLDDCLNGERLHAYTAALVQQLDSYTEVSPSGTGVKTIIRGGLNGFPRNRTKTTPWGGEFEVYDSRRYFTVTARHLPGTPTTVEPRQAELEDILARIWPPEPERPPTPPPTVPLPLDDEDLLARARTARNGPKFERLWAGDTSGHADDDSRAALALCGMLAFYTGPDPARIDSLFRRSGLYRPKWERQDYREQTIATALEGRTDFYEGGGGLPSRSHAAANGSRGAGPSEDRGSGDSEVLEGASQAGEPRPFSAWLIDAADLLAEPDPGPTPWLIEDLIVAEALVAIVGRWKTTKSYGLLDLCIALATGRPAFGKLAIPEPGAVVFINEESGRRALWRRLDALCRGRAIDPEELRGRLHVAANARVKLDDLGWQQDLVALGRELRPRLICFDPLARMKSPTRKENVQDEMAVLIEFVRQLRAETGAGVAFVHHTGHNGDHMRGASDLESVWESRLAWKRDGQSPEVTIESEHREAEAGAPLTYRVGWDGETRTMRFDLVADPLIETVRAYLTEHPDASANEVDENVEGNRALILAAVKTVRAESGSGEREPPGTTLVAPPLAGGSEEGDAPRRGAPSGTTADGPVPASGNHHQETLE